MTFDYHLPEELIALRPASPRDAARLLVVDPAATPAFADRMMLDLPELLQPGDALVFNDTKVIPAELRGLRRRDGASAQIAVTLIERLGARSLAGSGAPGQAAEVRRPHRLRRIAAMSACSAAWRRRSRPAARRAR